MDPAGATQTTEFSNPRLRQPLGFETTLGSNLNLILSQIRTFYGEGQGFTAQPWPNPHAYIHDISLRTHVQIRNPNLLDTFFGAQGQPLAFEPPSNPALPRRDITLSTHLQDTKLNLIGLDVMFNEAGKVPQYDWQLPVLAKFPLDLRGFIQSAALTHNLLSQDNIIPRSEHLSHTVEVILIRLPISLFQMNSGFIIDPSFIVLPPPIVIIPTQFINEFELGNTIINRALELFRKF